MRKYALILTISISILALLNCDKKNKTSSEIVSDTIITSNDATTAASQQTDSWIPLEDLTYNVIGYKKGLKGCTIEYSESLYRGGNILSANGAKILQGKGIKTVVSVTPDDNIATLCKTFNMRNIDMYYDYGKLSDSVIVTFLDLLDKEESPFYIHCFSGKQRAGLLCAIYRIYIEDWSFENAEIEYGKLGGKVEEDHKLLLKAHNIIKNRKKKI